MTLSLLKVPFALLLIFSLVLLPVGSSTLHACIDGINSYGSTQVAFLPNRRGLEMPEVDRTEMREARTKAKIVALTKQISTDGKTAERLAERAELHLLLNQTLWAVVDYDDAIKLEPKSFALRDRRLALNRELENLDQVEEDLTALIDIDKSGIRYLERAQFYVTQDENDKALNDFTLAIEFDPNLVEAYLGRGRIIHNRPYRGIVINGFDGEAVAEAAVDFAKAVELKPELLEPRRTLITSYMKLQRYSEAVEQATAILERAPDDECAKYYRAKSYKHEKTYDLALADLNELIEQRPDASKYFALRAEIYRDTKQVDKAIEDYRHNIEIDGDNYATHGLFARYLISNKRFEEAVVEYSKAIELNKFDQGIQAEFYGHRANAYYWLGKYEQAQLDFGTAAEISEFPGSYKLQRARILVANKRYEEANAVYEDMMDDNPRNMECFEERSRMYMVMHRYEDALKDINVYLSASTHNKEALLRRAKIWANIGNEDEVQEDLKRMREADKYWKDREAEREKRAEKSNTQS